jgi:hypothetical protein
LFLREEKSMKKTLLLFAFLLSFVSASAAQVFTSLYLPTAGTGLTLNIAAGRVFCASSMESYSTGTLTMTASTTNYVYLNTASSCVPAVKTTAFVPGDIPIAMVVAGSSSITTVTDDRSMFLSTPAGIPYPSAGLAKSTGSAWSTPSYSDIVALFAGGSCTGYLKSDGTCSTPTGGVISLNSLTGAVSITGDSSITVTPSGSSIALHATGSGSSGVQYNPSGTMVVFSGYSLVGDDHETLGALIPITSVNCNGTVCIVTNSGTNGLVAGNWIRTDTLASPSILNTPQSGFNIYTSGQTIFQVLSTGLSSTQFEFNYALATGTCASACGNIENAYFFLPAQASRMPFFQTSNVQSRLPAGTSGIDTLNSNFSTVFGTAPTSPAYIMLLGETNTIVECESAATLEADYQSVWAKAHTAGWTVVQSTLIPGTFNLLTCPTAWTTFNAVNGWLRGQGESYTNQASGEFWDSIVDGYSLLSNGNDANLLTGGYKSATALGQYASLFNNALATQGTVAQFPLFNSVLTTPNIGDATADSITFPNYGALVAINLGIAASGGYSTSEEIQGTANIGLGTYTGLIYLNNNGFWALTSAYGANYGVQLASILGPSTAPTGTCVSGLSGALVVSQDMKLTFCPSGGGTWTSFAGGAVSSLTTIGTGPATLIAGVLNIPTPTGGSCGSGNIPCTNTANSFTGGTQTITAANSATVPVKVAGSSNIVPAVIQHCTGTSSCTLSSNVTTGDALVAICADSGYGVSISDTRSSSWVSGSLREAYNSGGMEYALNVSAGSDTISCSSGIGLIVTEFSGVQTSGSPDVLTDLDGVNGSATATGVDMAITGVANAASTSVSFTGTTIASPFTLLGTSAGNVAMAAGAVSAGSVPITWSGLPSSTYDGPVLLLKAATGGTQTADLYQWLNPSGAVLSRVTGSGYFVSIPVPFSSLQPCTSTLDGAHAAVTDSTVNTWGATIIGGGSYHEPAYCNGTNWVVQ